MPISVCVCGMWFRLTAAVYALPPFVTSASIQRDAPVPQRMNAGWLKHGEPGTTRRWMSVVGEKERRGAHTFAPRQPCVISARHHVAFQCIISAGKMPDMQNQILLGRTPSSVRGPFPLYRLFSALSLRIRPFSFHLPFSFRLLLFSYLPPPIGSRRIQLSCRFVAVALAATVAPVTSGSRSARCTEHFSLFRSWTTR